MGLATKQAVIAVTVTARQAQGRGIVVLRDAVLNALEPYAEARIISLSTTETHVSTEALVVIEHTPQVQPPL